MNSSTTTQEQISAFADGELALADHDQILSALRAPAERAVCDDYHHIGDILRSVEMAAVVRPAFAAHMASRLANEPAHIGAAAQFAFASHEPVLGQQSWLKRFVMPGVAVVAALVLTVIAVPRMAVVQSGVGQQDTSVSRSGARVSNGAATMDVMRDPRMEEYLLAHQRFSPSVFSTAQFARSATFATESFK